MNLTFSPATLASVGFWHACELKSEHEGHIHAYPPTALLQVLSGVSRVQSPNALTNRDEIVVPKLFVLTNADGVPVGILQLTPFSGAVEMANIWVEPEHRKRGYLRQAVEFSETVARADLKASRVFARCHPETAAVAVHALTKRGYQDLGSRSTGNRLLVKAL